jgi:hypothetical protein
MVRTTYLSAYTFDENNCWYILSIPANMPKFNSISISGYHMQKQDHDIEFYVHSRWFEYIRTG